MLKVIEGLASNPDKWQKLEDKKKEDFFNLARKNNIRVKTHQDIQDEEREKERLKQIEMESLLNAKTLKLDFSQNEINNLNNNQENNSVVGYKSNNYDQMNVVSSCQLVKNSNTEPNDKTKAINKSIKKRLTIVESENIDYLDTRLDQSLINIYNQKKLSFIPVRKLFDESYEFGTQKVQIKIDGEIIRGK